MGFLIRLARKVAGRLDKASPDFVPSRPKQPDTEYKTVGATPERDLVPVEHCETTSLSHLRDVLNGSGEISLVIHWATWCDGCVEEVPALKQLHDEYGEKVRFIGVCWDSFQGSLSERELLVKVEEFILANEIGWRSLLVPNDPEALFDTLDMSCQTVPQLWVLNMSGDLDYQENGPLTLDAIKQLREAIERNFRG